MLQFSKLNIFLKVHVQDGDVPQEGALRASNSRSTLPMFCGDCCNECKSSSC